jgi:N-acetylmuramoyl-L-alanine amidase
MAQLLKMILEGTGAFDVVLTRDTDTFLELRQRANLLADAGCVLVISLHSNALDGTVRGTECFYSVDLPADRAIAAEISSRIAKSFGVPDRGAKSWAADIESPGKTGATKDNPEDHLAFIDQAQDRGIKHVFLLEALFHDNPKDEALLKNIHNLKLIMDIVAKVICEVFHVECLTHVQRALKALNYRLAERGAQQLDEAFWERYAKQGQAVDGGLVAAFIDRMTKLL